METPLTDQQLIEHSIEHPSAVFKGPDGRIVFQGQIFKTEEEFKTFLRIARSKPMRFMVWVSRLFKSKRK